METETRNRVDHRSLRAAALGRGRSEQTRGVVLGLGPTSLSSARSTRSAPQSTCYIRLVVPCLPAEGTERGRAAQTPLTEPVKKGQAPGPELEQSAHNQLPNPTPMRSQSASQRSDALTQSSSEHHRLSLALMPMLSRYQIQKRRQNRRSILRLKSDQTRAACVPRRSRTRPSCFSCRQRH